MRPVQLPAGLEDKGLEIYIHDGHLHVLYKGKQYHFELLPEEIRDKFVEHMMANKTAITSLKADFGLTEANEMLIQYIKCNFGNFDFIPDVDKDGTVYPECWNCGKRGECPGEGKVCGRIKGSEGILARRETEVYFLIIEGKSHKMIASHFDCSIPTIEEHLKRIRYKLGCHNSIEIMDFALRRKHI